MVTKCMGILWVSDFDDRTMRNTVSYFFLLFGLCKMFEGVKLVLMTY